MKRPLLTFTLMLLLAIPCMSAQFNVPSQYSTIAEAMIPAGVLDTIYLAAGNYSGTGFINLDNSSGWSGRLVAPDGPKETVIDLEGNRFFTGRLRVDGITFRNGSIAIETYDMLAKNCSFESNIVGVKSVGVWTSLNLGLSSFVDNDTGVVAIEPWSATAGGCNFLFNDVAIQIHVGTADFFLVGGSVFGFNSRCFKDFDGASAQYCTFFKNDTVGTAFWEACHLFWENNHEVPTAVPSKESDEIATIFFTGDPLFCDSTLMTGTDVSIFSPCLPENNACIINLGNVSVGCGCGNADLLLDINVSDLTYIVSYLFRGGPAPAPIEAGETDGILDVNVNDLTYLVSYLFKGGPEPLCP